jgi:UDP-3-O-[3-hydroxymyristoyl] glucosamine N-acyltransferase LpxD
MKFGLEVQQNFLRRMKGNHLSILKNAGENSITYYVGDNVEHIKHLKNCTLICKEETNFNLSGDVEIIRVEDPQLEFYKISKLFKKDYLENDKLIYVDKHKSFIHQDCDIHSSVRIGPNCVIGNCKISEGVEIHANVTIYSETIIEKNVLIESNTVIGSAGVMWVWDKNERVILEQLGNVRIKSGTRIGSLIEIVRGSANETTTIGSNTCIAHGTLIGHGCKVGDFVHFANGVKLGGSVEIDDYNFIGSGAIISPGVKLLSKDIIIGSGATVVESITEEGVYVGTPAKRLKSSKGKLNGVPNWRKL